jgi:hypothetical protein
MGSMVSGTAPDFAASNVDEMVQRLKDPQTARTLAAATGVPEQEVSSNLSQIADRAQAARDNPAQAATEVRQSIQQMVDRARAEGRLEQAAERAKAGATKTAWVTFGAMVLALVAAVLGAMSGRVAAVRAIKR